MLEERKHLSPPEISSTKWQPDHCIHISNPTTPMQKVSQSVLLFLVVHVREDVNTRLPISQYQVMTGCSGEQTAEDPEGPQFYL